MIDEIRKRFCSQQYEYSLHAADQSILRRIARREVEEAMETADIIEDYPTDKYGPSCLILVGPPMGDHCNSVHAPST